MLMISYIENHYGNKRGNKASFLRDNPDILAQELNRWINAELKVNLETGEIYKPTSKKIKLKKEETAEISSVSPETAIKLKSCAEQVNMNSDKFINYLLDDEISRNQILNDRTNKVDKENESNAHVQVISEIINRHFSILSGMSEIHEYQVVFEELKNELLEKKLINLQVSENSIAESQRLYIPRIAYYWYGGVLAKRIAKMLGAYNIYLWNEIFAAESEVIFVGMPNNVVACYLICERVCKLLKNKKSVYKKEQGGWGRKKDIEDASNQYVYLFAKDIIKPEIYIWDDESQMRLISYATRNYPYATD